MCFLSWPIFSCLGLFWLFWEAQKIWGTFLPFCFANLWKKWVLSCSSVNLVERNVLAAVCRKNRPRALYIFFRWVSFSRNSFFMSVCYEEDVRLPFSEIEETRSEKTTRDLAKNSTKRYWKFRFANFYNREIGGKYFFSLFLFRSFEWSSEQGFSQRMRLRTFFWLSAKKSEPWP